MPRNNNLGSQPQSTPMPRDFNPETDDFSITRTVDGHDAYPTGEDRGDGIDTSTRANRHTPSAPESGDYS